MNTNTFLDHHEIHSLTSKERRPAQTKVLKAMGIEHKVRPDGSIAILRAHIIKVFDGGPSTHPRKEKITGPNWAAI